MARKKPYVEKLGLDMSRFGNRSVRLNRLQIRIEKYLARQGDLVLEHYRDCGSMTDKNSSGFRDSSAAYHVNGASVTIWQYEENEPTGSSLAEGPKYVVGIYSNDKDQVIRLSSELQALDPRGRLSHIEKDAESYEI